MRSVSRYSCHFCYKVASKELEVNSQIFYICINCFYKIKFGTCNLCGLSTCMFDDYDRCVVCMRYNLDMPIR